MAERLGKYTIILNSHPSVTGFAAVVGKTEGEGPLKDEFDFVFEDDTLGEASFEKAESALQKEAVTRALSKAGKTPDEVDFSLAGDLLNQCIGSSFGLRSLNMPFIGLYGACSTMALSLGLASMLVDCGAARVTVASTSSHFCSAERQFRLPLEYGGQRTPTSQRTATAAGASVVERKQSGKPAVDAVTIGRITDLGIKDANNMGAAMAPAAIDTLIAHFNDTHRTPDYYDMILTGDLGVVGSDILVELMLKEGFDIRTKHKDCGKMIFDIEEQDVHAGGSGCGCCGSVFCGYVYRELKRHNLSKVLVMATGALMNPMIIEQGESIPAIAHAVAIEI